MNSQSRHRREGEPIAKLQLKDRLGAVDFLVEDIVTRLTDLPSSMLEVRDILSSDILCQTTPSSEYPTELCESAAAVLRIGSSTSQLFHLLINLSTLSMPPEDSMDHTTRQRLTDLQGKLGRMENHLSAGLGELSDTVRLAMQKAPLWHVHSRTPHLALAGSAPSPTTKRHIFSPNTLLPPDGTLSPPGSIPDLRRMDTLSPCTQGGEFYVSSSPTKARPSRIWGASDADAAALAKFAAAASAHTVRRVALSLVSAMCLVERELQTVDGLACRLLGRRATAIWSEPSAKAECDHSSTPILCM